MILSRIRSRNVIYTILISIGILATFVPMTVWASTVQDWPLMLNGITSSTLTKEQFEALCTPENTLTWISAENDTYSGIALWRLVALVDGSGGSFDNGLAGTNYTVKITSCNDSYLLFPSTEMAGSQKDTYVIANKYKKASNGTWTDLPLDNGGTSPKPWYPLKFVGLASDGGGRRIGGLTRIEMFYAISTTFNTEYGTISPSPALAPIGGNLELNIIPKTGYRTVDVLVDGVSQGTVNAYTFTGVDSANHTISATFVSLAQPDWDLNGDGVCNIGDVVKVGLAWGQTGTDNWIAEDLNGDGVINIGDVVVLGLNWGATW